MAPATPALNLSLDPGRNLGRTAARGDIIAALAPARGPIAAGLTAARTAESAGAGATAAPRCLTDAGTSATALIQIQTAAWECLA